MENIHCNVPNASDGADYFYCGYCPRALKRADTLRHHVLARHNRYLCHRCFLHFTIKQELDDHICCKLFYCSHCPRTFANQKQYDNHCFQVHVDAHVVHKCHVCGNEFANKHRLAQHHQKTHERIFRLPGKCTAKSYETCKCQVKHDFQLLDI